MRRGSTLSNSSLEMCSHSSSTSATCDPDPSLDMDNQSKSSVKSLVRQSTFILDDQFSSPDEGASSNKKGAAAIIKLLPDDLQPYITMHFRMIREENKDLLRLSEKKDAIIEDLKERNQRLQDNEADSIQMRKNVTTLTNQFEREKYKNKALMKRLKASNNTTSDLIWYGVEIFQTNKSPVAKSASVDDTPNDKKSESYRQRKSAKAKYVHRSSQTVLMPSPDHGGKGQRSNLVQEQEKRFNNLKNVPEKCIINKKELIKMKKDISKLSAENQNLKRGTKPSIMHYDDHSTQTSNNENTEDKTQTEQIMKLLQEKDMLENNLKIERDKCLEKEKTLERLKQDLERQSIIFEDDKGNLGKAKTQLKSQIHRSSQTTDFISCGATMDQETNNPNTPNNVKPFKSQNETLKTELESLRRVKTPYLFMMINNITGYIFFKWKVSC